MRVGKAKRRWIAWCRYVQKTQTSRRSRAYGEIHAGQAKAFEGATFANAYPPKGARSVWYPRWGSIR